MMKPNPWGKTPVIKPGIPVYQQEINSHSSEIYGEILPFSKRKCITGWIHADFPFAKLDYHRVQYILLWLNRTQELKSSSVAHQQGQFRFLS